MYECVYECVYINISVDALLLYLTPRRYLVRGDIRVGYHVYCAQPTVDFLRSNALRSR
jgi:hypothetical protein